MSTLRKPFFFLALALIAFAVLVEIGAVGLIRSSEPSDAAIRAFIETEGSEGLDGLLPPDRELEINRRVDKVKEQRLTEGPRPGLGISYLALLDAVVLFTVGLMGSSLVLKDSTQARLQGCATLIFGIILLLIGIVLLIVAISLLLFMLGLLASLFGIIGYIAAFAFFNKAGALITLGFLMALKLGFGASMIAAQQGFLKNKGLVLLVITSLVANLIVAFLIGLVPGFFASVADAIAAIVVAILALIWTLILLVGSVIAVLKALQPS
ncbi:MAG: hypothetical protein ABI670_07425 [Chloroflexota bacterium]